MVSVIFGMMALSFPVGAYIVFESGVGGDIGPGYPLDSLGLFVAGIGLEAPSAGVLLGDAFTVLWCVYAAVFALAAVGPCRGLYAELSAAMGHDRGGPSGHGLPHENYMHAAVRWFAILVLASAAATALQLHAGIPTDPPPAGNDLLRFFEVAKAPLVEEVGFRVVLVGVPLYLACAGEATVRSLARTLWHPFRHLPRTARTGRAAAALVVGTAVFFGAAHVISDEPWGAGKFVQASASGAILGWVYYRHGLAPAVLVHWAANYFVFSYAYMAADASSMDLAAAFGHPLLQTIEGVFVAAGAVAGSLAILNMAAARARGAATLPAPARTPPAAPPPRP